MITAISNMIGVTSNTIDSNTVKIDTIADKTVTFTIKALTTKNKISSNVIKTYSITNKTSSNTTKIRANMDRIFANPNERFKIQDKAVPITPPIPSLLSTLAKRTNQPCNPNFAKELISPSLATALCKGSTSIEKKDYICLKMNKIRAAHNNSSYAMRVSEVLQVQFPHSRFVSVDTDVATQSRTAHSCNR